MKLSDTMKRYEVPGVLIENGETTIPDQHATDLFDRIMTAVARSKENPTQIQALREKVLKLKL